MEVPVPLNRYLTVFKRTCQHVHAMTNSSQMDPFPRLLRVVGALDRQCIMMEIAFASQLKSMGSREKWERTYGTGGMSPLAINRSEAMLIRKLRRRIEEQWAANLSKDLFNLPELPVITPRPTTKRPKTSYRRPTTSAAVMMSTSTMRNYWDLSTKRSWGGRMSGNLINEQPVVKDFEADGVTEEPAATFYRVDNPQYPEWWSSDYMRDIEGGEIENSRCSPRHFFLYPSLNYLTQYFRVGLCATFYLPEHNPKSEFFDRDFFTDKEVALFQDTDRISQLRDAYRNHQRFSGTAPGVTTAASKPEDEEEEIREKRQLAMLGAAGAGLLLSNVANNVASWFGFGSGSDGANKEQVERMNMNTAHMQDLAAHLGTVELVGKRLAKQELRMMAREERIELVMELSATTRSHFSQMNRVMDGLNTLFHTGNVSPMLIDSVELYKAIQKLEIKASKDHEVLLIGSYSDVWSLETSYYLMDNLELLVVIHVPTGKSESRHQLYQHVSTPLELADEGHGNSTFTFLARPRESWIAYNPSTGEEEVMSDHDVEKCPRVTHSIRYCPQWGFEYKVKMPSCVSALWDGDADRIVKQCPIIEFKNDVFIAQLDVHSFVVNSPERVSTRLTCTFADDSQTQVLEGLQEIKLKDGCRLTADLFRLEPVPGLNVRDEGHQTVDIKLENTTLKQAVEWAKSANLLAHYAEQSSPTISEIASHWDQSQLVYERQLTFWQWIIIILVSSGATIVILIVIKVLWDRRSKLKFKTAQRELKEDADRRLKQLEKLLPRQEMEMSPMGASAPASNAGGID